MMKNSLKIVIALLLLCLLSGAALASPSDTLNMPAQLTTIEEKAFYGSTSIVRVVLPEGITEIGKNAFANSSILEIYMPASLKDIAENAFDGCSDALMFYAPEGSIAYNWCLRKGYDVSVPPTPLTDFGYIMGHSSVMIIGYNGSDTDVIIPSRIGGLPVYRLGEYAFAGLPITSVVIPDSVTEIDRCVFEGCPDLSSVQLSQNLISIGESAFSGCSSLQEIQLPDSLKFIDDYAFLGCDLEQIEIPKSLIYTNSNPFIFNPRLHTVTIAEGNTAYSLQDGVLFTNDGKTLVCYPVARPATSYTTPAGVEVIGTEALCVAENLTSLTISEGVTKLGPASIADCHALETVSLPSTLKTIEDYAFQVCTSLKRVTIPEGVDSIALGAFGYCSSLEEIILPEGLNSIESTAFEKCAALTEITIPASVSSIADDAFVDCSDTLIFHVTSGSYAENWASNLSLNYEVTGTHTPAEEFTYTVYNSYAHGTDIVSITDYTGTNPNVVVPDYIDGYLVGSVSIKRNTLLESIILPKGVIAIPYEGFYGCTNLKYVYFPEGLRSIGSWAFSSRLENISFPSTLEDIGAYTFNYCTSLTSLDLPEGLRSLDVYCFAGCTGLTEIVLPETVESVFGSPFAECTNLERAVLPKNLEVINGELFRDCTSLKEVIMPEKLDRIYDPAFENCSSLESIILPETLREFPSNLFAGCTSLKSVEFRNDNPEFNDNTDFNDYNCEYFFSDSPDLVPKVYRYGNWHQYFMRYGIECEFFAEGDYAYAPMEDGTIEIRGYCGDETVLTIPDTLMGKKVSNFVLAENTNLEKVILPEDLPCIKDFAFAGCASLQEIVLPESIASIGKYAFADCWSLSSINIPEGIERIEEGTFFNCSGYLTEIDIPESVKIIGYEAFSNCYSLETITGMEGVLAIEGNAFYHCPSLKNISLGKNLESIFDHAFGECTSLTELTLPATLADMPDSAFWNCPNLALTVSYGSFPHEWCFYNEWPNYTVTGEPTAAELFTYSIDPDAGVVAITAYNGEDPNVVVPQTIDDYYVESVSLAGNTEITSVTLPAGAYIIPEGAFAGCTNLETVKLSETTDIISNYAFQDCVSLKNFDLPAYTYSIGAYAFSGCTSLPEIHFPAYIEEILGYAFENCTSLETADFFPGESSLLAIEDYAFTGCSALKEFDVPETVEYLGSSAFMDCSSLEKVSLPDRYDILNNPGIFNNCSSLKSIDFPKSMEYISESLFAGCSALESITIPRSVYSINFGAFANCTGLKNVSFPSSPHTSVSIESGAFVGCTSLENITLPASLYYIGSSAFAGCTSLTNLKFPQDMWGDIDATAFDECDNLTIQVYLDSNAHNWCIENEFPFELIQYNNLIYSYGGVYGYTGEEAEVHIPDVLEGYPVNSIYLQDNNFIETLYLPTACDWIYLDAFANCPNLKRIYLPSNISEIYNEPVNCSPDLMLYVYPGSPAHQACIAGNYPYRFRTQPLSDFGYVINDKGIVITSYSGSSPYVMIPDTIAKAPVVGIADSLFQNRSDIQGVYMPDTIVEIGDYAFEGCTGLTNIVLPMTLESLGDYAFANCTNLQAFVLDTYDDHPWSIGEGCFMNCSNLNPDQLVNFRSVDYIGSEAFKNCSSLYYFSMGEPLYYIGSNAFEGCSSIYVNCTNSYFGYEWCIKHNIPFFVEEQ